MAELIPKKLLLFIPFNTIELLKDWFPDAEIIEAKGLGAASGGSKSISSKMGEIRTMMRDTASLEFKTNNLQDSCSWNDVFTFFSDSKVRDVKLTTFCINYPVIKGYDYLFLHFRPFTLHAGLWRKNVADGLIPNQSMIMLQEQIKKEIRSAININNGGRKTKFALDTCKGTILILDSTEPKSAIDDTVLMRSLRNPPKLLTVETSINPWILKEYAYKKHG